jgi:hypothetical protein
LTILGVLAFVGGIIGLMLPETLDTVMPQTMEDGENFGKDQKFWDFPCCSGRAKKDPSPEAPTSTSNLKSGSWMRHSLRTSVRGEALRSSLLVKSKQNVGRTLTTRD